MSSGRTTVSGFARGMGLHAASAFRSASLGSRSQERFRARLGQLFGLSLLCFASLGASCDSGKPTDKPAAEANESATPVSSAGGGNEVEDLPVVDTSELTEAEKAMWVDLINDRLSPCGDPISVGKCAAAGSGCSACVPAARYLVRLVMDGKLRDEIAELYDGRFGKDPKLDIELGNSPVRGAPMAPVTIVEFSDFQCPFCGRAHPQISRALAELEGKVKLVFKHYPLSGHPRAVPAALAAEAAREQGKFWEMHDLLFEHQDKLADPQLIAYAEQLGLDVAKFKADMASAKLAERIEADREQGRQLGVDSTPSIFVNGRRLQEAPSALLAYLKEEVEL